MSFMKQPDYEALNDRSEAPSCPPGPPGLPVCPLFSLLVSFLHFFLLLYCREVLDLEDRRELKEIWALKENL